MLLVLQIQWIQLITPKILVEINFSEHWAELDLQKF